MQKNHLCTKIHTSIFLLYINTWLDIEQEEEAKNKETKIIDHILEDQISEVK